MDSELVMSVCAHVCVFLPLFKGEYGKSLAKGMITLLVKNLRFQEKSLWKSPDLTPPPANQSEPLASLGNGNESELNT